MVKIRIENDPKLAIEIMRKAGQRLAETHRRKYPFTWNKEYLNQDYINENLNVDPSEYIVVYMDDKPIASAILQHGDKTQWANWPTKKDALYGYKYAGNPDYPIFKTKIIFDALKKYAADIGVPVIRIDIADYELAKKRLYESQGFKTVAISQDDDSPEYYLLMEYDPRVR